ncbi:hypothetical protein BDK51DRAFT_25566 [Blyttiomyces helicus]|uniref:Uncharacterized protein n=1 Tax=Blyttiomyces helicus TaxID=388810 RepID=A0A4P9W2V1_9FUNG|nr:hypothetical protein BDK51DRAFT_25566 [Blyttiomyces helicus]|eukprot:RKO85715.1 hypothetical protein BDK51DRAFT_25566 [Blyttiomyces helicus]
MPARVTVLERWRRITSYRPGNSTQNVVGLVSWGCENLDMITQVEGGASGGPMFWARGEDCMWSSLLSTSLVFWDDGRGWGWMRRKGIEGEVPASLLVHTNGRPQLFWIELCRGGGCLVLFVWVTGWVVARRVEGGVLRMDAPSSGYTRDGRGT